MSSEEAKQRLLIITNLYPLPWDKTRGIFNFQQFEHLRTHFDLRILVPVAFPDYIKHRHQVKNSADLRFIPYLFTPKLLRFCYGWMMYKSILLFANTWIRKAKADFVFSTWAFPDSYAAYKLAERLELPFFYKVHGSDVHVLANNPKVRSRILASSNAARKVFTVSEDLRKKLIAIGVMPEKILTIYNGVEADKFSGAIPEKRERPFFLYVGNLKTTKGVYDLLSAFAKVSKHLETHDLVYIGSGEEASGLAKQTRQAGLENRVVFLGRLDVAALRPWIKACDALVLPSHSEGVPNVLLEAMAAGTPSIATRVGGIPEVIPNDESLGLLVPVGNIDHLGEALRRAAFKSWDVNLMSSSAIKFDWKENANIVAGSILNE